MIMAIDIKDITKLKLNIGEEAKEKIYNFLKKEKKAYSNEEIAKALGMSVFTVRCMTRILASDGKLKRVKKGRSYYYYC